MIRDEYKRAALKLYGLTDVDRTWILSRLDADQRAKLAGLLSQLEEIGLSRESARLADFDAGSAPRNEADVESSARLRIEEQIDTAPVAAVTEALSSEPSWMVALVLGLGPWKWSAQYLDAQASDRRASIRQHLDAPKNTNRKVRQAILRALAERLNERGGGRNGSAFERILGIQDGEKRVNGKRSWRGWIKWMH